MINIAYLSEFIDFFISEMIFPIGVRPVPVRASWHYVFDKKFLNFISNEAEDYITRGFVLIY